MELTEVRSLFRETDRYAGKEVNIGVGYEITVIPRISGSWSCPMEPSLSRFRLSIMTTWLTLMRLLTPTSVQQ